MYRCASWTIKMAEHRRIDAFELWCWRILLRVPWTSERSYQSILKETNPEYSLEGLMLKLKLRYFDRCEEPTHWKRPWCWERLRAGGEGDDRGWDDWMASLTHWAWIWASSGRWWRTGKPGVLQSTSSQRVGYKLAIKHTRIQIQNWLQALQIFFPSPFSVLLSSAVQKQSVGWWFGLWLSNWTTTRQKPNS